jgi:disulfide bond formation protein DsbB
MLIITNKMQCNTILSIAVEALHVSGGFPAHYQELKNCIYSIWYLLSLVAAPASVVAFSLYITEIIRVPEIRLGPDGTSQPR